MKPLFILTICLINFFLYWHLNKKHQHPFFNYFYPIIFLLSLAGVYEFLNLEVYLLEKLKWHMLLSFSTSTVLLHLMMRVNKNKLSKKYKEIEQKDIDFFKAHFSFVDFLHEKGLLLLVTIFQILLIWNDQFMEVFVRVGNS